MVFSFHIGSHGLRFMLAVGFGLPTLSTATANGAAPRPWLTSRVRAATIASRARIGDNSRGTTRPSRASSSASTGSSLLSFSAISAACADWRSPLHARTVTIAGSPKANVSRLRSPPARLHNPETVSPRRSASSAPVPDSVFSPEPSSV